MPCRQVSPPDFRKLTSKLTAIQSVSNKRPSIFMKLAGISVRIIVPPFVEAGSEDDAQQCSQLSWKRSNDFHTSRALISRILLRRFFDLIDLYLLLFLPPRLAPLDDSRKSSGSEFSHEATLFNFHENRAEEMPSQ